MGSHASDGTVHAHVAPLKVLFGVFFALIALTVITVVAADSGLGRWDFLVAMILATVKATLVALFFMHLKDDKTFNVLVIASAVLFLLLFLGLAILDVTLNESNLRPYDGKMG